MRRYAQRYAAGFGSLAIIAMAASLSAGCEDEGASTLIGDNGGNGPGTTTPEQDAFAILAAKVTAGAPIARNLSNREYFNVVSDLIGVRLSPSLQQTWTATTQFSGFDAVLWNDLDAKALRDRSETLEILLEGVVGSPKVMTCTAATAEQLAYDTCAATVIEPFATRAFGRPLSDAEKASFRKSYEAGIELAKSALTEPKDIFKDGVRTAMGSVLLAPQLISRIEMPPTPDFTGERELSAYELADRLAFTFFGSLPDDELWAAAQDGTLATPDVLETQAKRLLDTKTESFVKTFMGQWFDYRAFDSRATDSTEYAMWNESWRTMSEIVKSDLPVTAIVNPGFTYLNDTLATYYGIPGDFSKDFQRFETKDRGGVLQQGAWLTLSASPLKTSPMHRGRLVQDRLLCKVIPPPDSALFAKIQSVSASIPATATVKQRVEQHRNAGEVCFGCHQFMDPIGIGLEGFDQFGQVRTTYKDTGYPVETDSNLLGVPFANVSELSEKIAALPDYTRCAAEKLTVFSTRKAVHSHDGDSNLMDYLSYPLNAKAPSFREMLLRLVRSKAFRNVNHSSEKG